MKSEKLDVVRGSRNVFRDLGHKNADAEQVKAILAAEIIKALDREGLSVRAAHSRTGVAAADFSRIRHADLGRFTVDRLMSILNRLGSRVEVKVRVRRAERVAPCGFEFGETAEAEAFFSRHPNFYLAFELLAALVNKCFARPLPEPYYGPEYIRFSLGESCREDFLEILFLAVNGYGGGAAKLLRGLYERAVALAYMTKEPSKTERFTKFAAIQEYKALSDALKVTTETEWDTGMGPDRTAAEIRKRFEAAREDFQQTDCRKCKTKRLAITWDLDVSSMVARLGPPYDIYYLLAYTNANLEIHATLASALREDNKDTNARRTRRRAKADTVIFHAAMLLVEVIRSENTLFALGLNDDLQAAEEAMGRVWKESIDAREAVR